MKADPCGKQLFQETSAVPLPVWGQERLDVGQLREMPGQSVVTRTEGLWTSDLALLTEDELQVLGKQLLTVLRKYLSSWSFRDIGPVTAARIVSAFGLKTPHVIRRSPQELMTVKGVGRKRMMAVLNGWKFQPRLIRRSSELMRMMSSDR